MSHHTTIVFALLLVLSLTYGCSERQPAVQFEDTAEEKQVYFGDLHNHNEIGQIRGSLERSFDIARSHLDFFAFTPQSQWMDMVEIPMGRNAQFIRGFNATKANWEKMNRLTEEFYRPGEFVTFHGYEVHFNEGDFHILFPASFAEFLELKNHREWNEYAKRHGAIIIPHHPAYKPGWRGFDWDHLDPEVTPVVEIMSMHGNAESDRSLIRYLRHSMGGRYTNSTVQRLWEKGIQAGVVASTDDHLGHPGAYGQGLAAVWADSLSREDVMEAIRARRTYGVNADRIRLDFRMNGRWMGETLSRPVTRNVRVRVKGEDVVDRVEVLRNNQVIYRNHPVDRRPGALSWEEPVLARVEFGWGPWADFDMQRVADWRFRINVNGGKLLSASPHFQSRPFDENRRNRIVASGDDFCEVASHTSRLGAYEDKATNDVVLEIQGTPETEIVMTLEQPARQTFRTTLGELAEANDIFFTGPFTSESVLFHRVVFAEHYRTDFSFTDRRNPTGTDWYYVRVVQTNGSVAWSSPIWVESE